MTPGIEFGFLPEDKTYTVGRISISPLSTIATTVTSVRESDRTDGLWYYPPLVPFKDFQADGRRKPLTVEEVLRLAHDLWLDLASEPRLRRS